MNEVANTTQKELSLLDDLATQAQMFSFGAAMNLLQLGRVLTEARPLVPQGQWIEWVQTNAHLPERRAQEYMQAYRKFGIDQRIAQLGPSQIIALLPMTDEERDRLMAENDVGGMTNRELKEAIRAQRETLRAEAMAEAQGAIAQAEADRDAAIRRASELEVKEPEIPPELTDELNKNRAEIARLQEIAKDSLEDAQALRRENTKLKWDIQEQEDILREQQEAMNRTQEELLNLKSAQARGDAERPTGDELTIDVFSQAVREFMGLVARMPYMQNTFGSMPQDEKQQYAELLRTVEGWTTGARQALNSYCVEGGIIVE